MPIDKINPMLPREASQPLSGAVKRQDWGSRSVNVEKDPYNLELKTVLQRSLAKGQTGSVSCPPCNETNNSCGGTQCCTPDCSGNPNCR